MTIPSRITDSIQGALEQSVLTSLWEDNAAWTWQTDTAEGHMLHTDGSILRKVMGQPYIEYQAPGMSPAQLNRSITETIEWVMQCKQAM